MGDLAPAHPFTPSPLQLRLRLRRNGGMSKSSPLAKLGATRGEGWTGRLGWAGAGVAVTGTGCGAWVVWLPVAAAVTAGNERERCTFGRLVSKPVAISVTLTIPAGNVGSITAPKMI